jgi:hypothetical protein
MSFGFDQRVLSGFDVGDVRASKDPASAAFHSIGEAGHVTNRVELSLSRETKAWTCIETRQWRASHSAHARHPRALRGLQLHLEHFLVLPWSKKQKTIDTPKVAFNAFFIDDLLDVLDGSRVAVGSKTGALFSVQPLDLEVPVIESIREVSGRPPGLTACNRAVIQHHDGFALTQQGVRSAQTGDARADDTDVGCFISGKHRS